MSFKPTWSYGTSAMMNIGPAPSPYWSYGQSIIWWEFLAAASGTRSKWLVVAMSLVRRYR